MARKRRQLTVFELINPRFNRDRRTKAYRMLTKTEPVVLKQKKPPTEAQIKQRFRFGMVVTFVKHLKPMAEIGLRPRTQKMSVANYLTKYILKNAVRGDYPDFTIDYSAISVGVSQLDAIHLRDASLTNMGILMIAWYATDSRYDTENEQIYLLIYNATDQLSYNFPVAALRKYNYFTVQIPEFSVNNDYHTWIFARKPNCKKASNSEYFHPKAM